MRAREDLALALVEGGSSYDEAAVRLAAGGGAVPSRSRVAGMVHRARVRRGDAPRLPAGGRRGRTAARRDLEGGELRSLRLQPRFSPAELLLVREVAGECGWLPGAWVAAVADCAAGTGPGPAGPGGAAAGWLRLADAAQRAAWLLEAGGGPVGVPQRCRAVAAAAGAAAAGSRAAADGAAAARTAAASMRTDPGVLAARAQRFPPPRDRRLDVLVEPAAGAELERLAEQAGARSGGEFVAAAAVLAASALRGAAAAEPRVAAAASALEAAAAGLAGDASTAGGGGDRMEALHAALGRAEAVLAAGGGGP